MTTPGPVSEWPVTTRGADHSTTGVREMKAARRPADDKERKERKLEVAAPSPTANDVALPTTIPPTAASSTADAPTTVDDTQSPPIRARYVPPHLRRAEGAGLVRTQSLPTRQPTDVVELLLRDDMMPTIAEAAFAKGAPLLRKHVRFSHRRQVIEETSVFSRDEDDEGTRADAPITDEDPGSHAPALETPGAQQRTTLPATVRASASCPTTSSSSAEDEEAPHPEGEAPHPEGEGAVLCRATRRLETAGLVS